MTAPTLQDARSVADLTAGVVLASVEIAVPPERVFRALTDPDQLMHWWGSPDTYRIHEWTADVRVGGRWRSQGRSADGRPFTVGGEYLEVVAPHKIVQTWVPDWEGRIVTTLTYRLEAIPGGTRLTVRHEGFGEHRGSCQSHGLGWERVLRWLRDYVAREGARTKTKRPSMVARYFNPLRVTSYLLVLYCLGHTGGALLSTPHFGAAADAVLSSMKSVHFMVQGFDRTWFGFYLGFGLFDSIFFLLSAAITWFLGGWAPAQRRALAPLIWALFLSQTAGAVLAWTYFFIAPGVLSTVISALLGFEAVKSRTSAPVS